MLATVTVTVTDAPANMTAPRVIVKGQDGQDVRVPMGNTIPYEPRAAVHF